MNFQPTALDELIKSFSNPALELVKHTHQGIGLHPALFDAIFDDSPLLALLARRKDATMPCPGVTDTPSSRRLLDEAAANDDSTMQVAALLSGGAQDVAFDAPILWYLLAHVPALPIASVAALHEPTNLSRRLILEQRLTESAKTGRLPTSKISGLDMVDRQNYADFAQFMPHSPLVSAWLGSLRIFAQIAQPQGKPWE